MPTLPVPKPKHVRDSKGKWHEQPAGDGSALVCPQCGGQAFPDAMNRGKFRCTGCRALISSTPFLPIHS